MFWGVQTNSTSSMILHSSYATPLRTAWLYRAISCWKRQTLDRVFGVFLAAGRADLRTIGNQGPLGSTRVCFVFVGSMRPLSPGSRRGYRRYSV